MTPAQEAAWVGLLEVAKRVPTGWCLVGGQMVHLLCWERGREPQRPTDDGDAILDIRARPTIMRDFTSALVGSGFGSAGESFEGHQHRWTNGRGQIDILIPVGVGERGRLRGVTGGTTVSAPGGQNALFRAEPVTVRLNGRVGIIHRPNLQGALLSKAYAYGVVGDVLRDRHLVDFAVLSTLVRFTDSIGVGLDRKEGGKMMTAVIAAEANVIARNTAGAAEGLARVRQVMVAH